MQMNFGRLISSLLWIELFLRQTISWHWPKKRIFPGRCSTWNTSRVIVEACPQSRHKTVDPSLFPFCFQRSRCLKGSTVDRHDCIDQCGKGQIAGPPQGPEGQHIGSLRGRGCYANDKAWSQQYQWLPFEVKFDENMTSTQYACSINLPCPITV